MSDWCWRWLELAVFPVVRFMVASEELCDSRFSAAWVGPLTQVQLSVIISCVSALRWPEWPC